MSESDKFAVQGRAYAELRAIDARLATGKLALKQFARELGEMGQAIGTLADNPDLPDNPHAGKTRSQNLKEHLTRLEAQMEGMKALMLEYHEDNDKGRALRDEIAKF